MTKRQVKPGATVSDPFVPSALPDRMRRVVLEADVSTCKLFPLSFPYQKLVEKEGINA